MGAWLNEIVRARKTTLLCLIPRNVFFMIVLCIELNFCILHFSTKIQDKKHIKLDATKVMLYFIFENYSAHVFSLYTIIVLF